MFDAAAGDSSSSSSSSINQLSDDTWNEIASLLPEPSVLGRRRSTDPRRIVAAISYQWRTGCPWRKLPPGFPPWPTIYGYVAAWRRDGTLRKLRPLLDPKQRERRRRCDEPLSAKLNPFREPPRVVPALNSATPAKVTLPALNRQDRQHHDG
jgi:transposase